MDTQKFSDEYIVSLFMTNMQAYLSRSTDQLTGWTAEEAGSEQHIFPTLWNYFIKNIS